MSWRLMDRVALLPVTDEQFRILMLLAQRAQDDGTGARPGIKKLMERTGKSERAVQRALHDLQAAGLIVATSYLTGGRGHATEYRLVLPNGDGRGTLSPTTRPETVAPMAPITTAPAVNGATHDALSVTKGATNDALTPVKGDASDAVSPERVPSMTLKGATGGTPIGPEYIRGDAGTSGRRNEEGATGEGRASPRPPAVRLPPPNYARGVTYVPAAPGRYPTGIRCTCTWVNSIKAPTCFKCKASLSELAAVAVAV
ncbi:MAG TPA: helix-turn-helix domain-containing protein [Hyphomicrobiaceae bacterium]|nr:helix-turn-helix domain-containing protein [Hyphomicrobiaceae bacterium]